VKEEHQIS